MTFWRVVAANVVALLVFAAFWHVVGYLMAPSDDDDTPSKGHTEGE